MRINANRRARAGDRRQPVRDQLIAVRYEIGAAAHNERLNRVARAAHGHERHRRARCHRQVANLYVVSDSDRRPVIRRGSVRRPVARHVPISVPRIPIAVDQLRPRDAQRE